MDFYISKFMFTLYSGCSHNGRQLFLLLFISSVEVITGIFEYPHTPRPSFSPSFFPLIYLVLGAFSTWRHKGLGTNFMILNFIVFRNSKQCFQV